MGLLNWFWPPRPPATLVLRGYHYFLDGGTTILTGTDERGRTRAVMLVQNALPGRSSFGRRGRLYLDGWAVPVRSEREARVLAALRAAEVRYTPPDGEPDGEGFKLGPNVLVLGDDIEQVLTRGPEDNIRELRDEVVRKVESADYPTSRSDDDPG